LTLQSTCNVSFVINIILFFVDAVYTTIKITSEFRNMSVTVRVVDGLALNGKQTSAASTGGILVITRNVGQCPT